MKGEKNKALREQGLTTIAKAPTKAQGEVVFGEYQRFNQVAIRAVQFVDQHPVTASCRVMRSHRVNGVRVAINGRDGRAECFLISEGQIDELVDRLTSLKTELFGKKLGEVK